MVTFRAGHIGRVTTPAELESPRAEQEAGKTTVNMRFDAALLRRIDHAAKAQGISRTAWLHVAASKALEA